jgi:hypothetical protein
MSHRKPKTKIARAVVLTLGVVATMLCGVAHGRHTQVIEKFSFDMEAQEYPRAYETTGVAVPLLSRVKIVPTIPNVAGQIFTQEVSHQCSLKMETRR